MVEPGSGGLRRNNRRDDALIASDIAERRGALTPEIVVEEARAPDHPWHSEFEWNDGVASDRYRIDQARRLIARVRITVVQGTSRVAQIAFVHDPAAGLRQGYVTVTSVRDDAAKARDVIVTELQRVQSSLRRCLSLASVLGLSAQVERLLLETEGLVEFVTLDGDELGEAMAA